MKLRNLSLPIMALIGATVAQTASAQVIIGFTSAAAVSPVPLSPWLTATLAVMLAVMGLVFIRQKTGRGLFLLMLSVGAGGGAMLQTTDGYAYGSPTVQALTVSGADVTGTDVASFAGPMFCGPIGYVWVKSSTGTVTISSLAYRSGYSALDPASPPQPPDVTLPTPSAPVCTVGTSLTGAGSCVVWYHKLSGMC